MPEFLSAEWIAALDEAARAGDGLAADPPLVVETRVHGEDGELGYQVRFGPDGATVAAAGTGDADVVLITDPATAWSLHEGTVRAQDAFVRGALKVRGRPELLAARAEQLTALERALAPVRATTTAPPNRETPDR